MVKLTAISTGREYVPYLDRQPINQVFFLIFSALLRAWDVSS